jgi:hypothetical protein
MTPAGHLFQGPKLPFTPSCNQPCNALFGMFWSVFSPLSFRLARLNSPTDPEIQGPTFHPGATTTS